MCCTARFLILTQNECDRCLMTQNMCTALDCDDITRVCVFYTNIIYVWQTCFILQQISLSMFHHEFEKQSVITDFPVKFRC